MNNIKISLGKNCNPRIYLKEHFNLTKKNGYNSCPFDLCITSFKALCKTLEANFNNFFDDLKIITWSNGAGDRISAGKGLTCITNKNGIIFNHEGAGHSHLFKEGKNDDEFYTRNNFKEFRKRYSSRILNFKNYCKNSNEITFVYNDKDFDESMIQNIIINTYGEKTIKFISLVKN
ncbi:Papain-like cystein peptidase [Chrysochromulina ericina virus CeV-01B]|uniref:Papain-like cystein peptidase n=1 Tax=Chrysochromulina ericina virus CeV-01B TaxID=3070830 RepID=A0A0N9QXW4_9VIRU|nr:Papain-like cystein peptidase [Chrysochromulina ericina virus]ALH22939.1 Papain-like cystein peptidase [Chrysochromulina ericina virus CeV-01B]